MDTPTHAVRILTPPGLRERVTAVARAAGLHPAPTAVLTLVVVAGHHLPESLDQLMVDSAPHLVLRILPDEVVVGPFVAPGVGACARCVAVGLADDSDDSVLALARAFGDPDPHAGLDAGAPGAAWHLLALGVSRAACEIVAYGNGEIPSTWSATWTAGPAAHADVRQWRRHAWCGCNWFDLPAAL